ncbi:MAG: hypothetical protein NT041_01605 [Candidatus Vogelbacteria bacterium]|nr:hypothetical protein [Candidatus Vogelbacteria bacterium]
MDDKEKHIWPRLDQDKEAWIHEPEREKVTEIRKKLGEEVRKLLDNEGFEDFRDQCYQIESRWLRA